MTGRAHYVIVIGGGANGLVAAAALARAGRKVLLLERGELVGGQGRMHEFAPGFRAPVPGTDQGWLPDSVARGLGLPGLARATPEEQARIQTLLKSPGLSDPAIEEMRELVARYDGVGYATARAMAYAEQGKDTLEAFSPCEERETLALIADYVVDRDR